MTYPEWLKTGRKDCLDYAKIKLEEILANHNVSKPLTPDQEKDLGRILKEARDFYDGYSKAVDGLQFETESYAIELHQVWVQQTAAGNYVKLLIKGIENYEGESGNKYNVVTMDYTYQPNAVNRNLLWRTSPYPRM